MPPPIYKKARGRTPTVAQRRAFAVGVSSYHEWNPELQLAGQDEFNNAARVWDEPNPLRRAPLHLDWEWRNDALLAPDEGVPGAQIFDLPPPRKPNPAVDFDYGRTATTLTQGWDSQAQISNAPRPFPKPDPRDYVGFMHHGGYLEPEVSRPTGGVFDLPPPRKPRPVIDWDYGRAATLLTQGWPNQAQISINSLPQYKPRQRAETTWLWGGAHTTLTKGWPGQASIVWPAVTPGRGRPPARERQGFIHHGGSEVPEIIADVPGVQELPARAPGRPPLVQDWTWRGVDYIDGFRVPGKVAADPTPHQIVPPRLRPQDHVERGGRLVPDIDALPDGAVWDEPVWRSEPALAPQDWVYRPDRTLLGEDEFNAQGRVWDEPTFNPTPPAVIDWALRGTRLIGEDEFNADGRIWDEPRWRARPALRPQDHIEAGARLAPDIDELPDGDRSLPDLFITRPPARERQTWAWRGVDYIDGFRVPGKIAADPNPLIAPRLVPQDHIERGGFLTSLIFVRGPGKISAPAVFLRRPPLLQEHVYRADRPLEGQDAVNPGVVAADPTPLVAPFLRPQDWIRGTKAGGLVPPVVLPQGRVAADPTPLVAPRLRPQDWTWRGVDYTDGFRLPGQIAADPTPLIAPRLDPQDHIERGGFLTSLDFVIGPGEQEYPDLFLRRPPLVERQDWVERTVDLIGEDEFNAQGRVWDEPRWRAEPALVPQDHVERGARLVPDISILPDGAQALPALFLRRPPLVERQDWVERGGRLVPDIDILPDGAIAAEPNPLRRPPLRERQDWLWRGVGYIGLDFQTPGTVEDPPDPQRRPPLRERQTWIWRGGFDGTPPERLPDGKVSAEPRYRPTPPAVIDWVRDNTTAHLFAHIPPVGRIWAEPDLLRRPPLHQDWRYRPGLPPFLTEAEALPVGRHADDPNPLIARRGAGAARGKGVTLQAVGIAISVLSAGCVVLWDLYPVDSWLSAVDPSGYQNVETVVEPSGFQKPAEEPSDTFNIWDI